MKLDITNGAALVRMLALLLGVILVFGGSLLGYGISWAAPEQNPNQQTVPPRPPDPPPPPPPPPPVPPAPAPPNQSQSSDTDTPDSSIDSSSVDQPLPTPSTLNRPTLPSAPTALPSQTDGSDEVSQPDPTAGSKTIEGPDESLSAESSEPTTNNNNDSSPESFGQADLSLSKTVNNSAPNVGEVITYTLVISNNGPNLATNIGVSDLLPTGVNRIVALSGRGYYYADTGLWTLDTLSPNQSATLTVTVMVANAGTITNTAEITTTSLFDPDSIPGNGIESEDDQASVSISASTKPPAAPLQADSNGVSSTSSATPAIATFPFLYQASLIHWIFALIVGVIFIFVGLFLVNRS